MELKKAILDRHSVRGFLPTQVTREQIEELLTLACRAVSANNIQPWRIAVVTGEKKDAIAKRYVENIQNGVPTDLQPPKFTGVYQERRVGVAKALLGEMGIAREDRAARDAWMLRGFRFFDAPALLLLFGEEAFLGYSTFDFGCLAQNICLAAYDMGLGTCVEYQAAAYQSLLREALGIEEGWKCLCGIALGYEDPDFPANRVRTTREALANNTQWYGF